MKKIIAIATITIFSIRGFAQQLDISADMRMRYEYRHGFSTLFNDTLKAASFIVQRSRINIDFGNKDFKIRISPQNTRVWGDVATNSKSDVNNQLHEAWAEWLASKYLSLRAGRQELNYDDTRILGNVDWTMQARSHDLVLLKLKPDSNNNLHLGIAVNANKETNMKENYALTTQYKNMQFLWYNGKFGPVSLSVLFLNQGIPYLNGTKEKLAYNQTFGPRITYSKKQIMADAAMYLQTGKLGSTSLSASYFSGNFNYKTGKGFIAGAGFEYLSGKATNSTTTGAKSFNPWYGTNHKFNGFMDYFYVGNHINNVGLTDVYVNLAYEKNKIKLKLTPHYFATAAGLYKGDIKQGNYLGTEVDFTLNYQLADFVQLNFGYSQMLASTSMEVLKGGNKDISNNWAYLSLHFNPRIFSYKADQKK